jgi:hypothetical protein
MIRDMRDMGYAQVESELLRDPTITPQCKALYGLLITYGPSRIFPGHETLAGCLGVKRRTVITWLTKLKALGLIDWARREGTSNDYFILGYKNLLRLKLEGVIQGSQGVCNQDHRGCDLGDTGSRSPYPDPINKQSASADALPALTTPEIVEESNDLWPGPRDGKEEPPAREEEQKESILEQTDPLSMAAECAKRNGDVPSWAMNGDGPDPWWEPLKAFCTITHRPTDTMTGKTGKAWLRQFAKIGEDKGIPPPLMVQATTALPGVQGVKWYISNNKWTSPWCDSYIASLDLLAAQLGAGLQVAREGNIVIGQDWYAHARK